MKKLIFSIFSLLLIFNITSCSTEAGNFTIYSDVPADVEIVADVEFGKGGDVPLLMNIIKPVDEPDSPLPAIVWIHGGGWIGGSREDYPKALYTFVEKGYFCVSIDYRLSDVALFPAQIEDCKAAVRYLRANAEKYSIDPNRIGVWGGSAGGHLAALMGASNGVKELEGNGGSAEFSSDVQASCDWFGVLDFRSLLIPNDHDISRLLGGPPQQNIRQAAEASPIVYVGEKSSPNLIMVGDKDEGYKIILNSGEDFKAKHKALRIYSEIKVVRGAGHGFDNPSEYEKVLDFFDKQLKK